MPAIASRTPRCTSTAAPASTWTRRRTATSPPRSAPSSTWAARPPNCAGSAQNWPRHQPDRAAASRQRRLIRAAFPPPLTGRRLLAHAVLDVDERQVLVELDGHLLAARVRHVHLIGGVAGVGL